MRKNRPAPGRPACKGAALPPLHPILHFSPPSSHPLCPLAPHPPWALPLSQKPPSSHDSTGPRDASGEGWAGTSRPAASLLRPAQVQPEPGWEHSSSEAVATTGQPDPRLMPRNSVSPWGRRKGTVCDGGSRTCHLCICCH